MRPVQLTSAVRLAALLAALSGLLAGCVYRMPIQQGNYLDGHTVRQLKVGMTRVQVRYLLGTPMIQDVFDTNRWDYVYYFKRGYVHRPIQSRVTVFFHDGKVSRFKLLDVPKGQPIAPGLLPSAKKFPLL
ncbi:MAG: outer membrane protein assembly factor BamE [Pseudomonadota bacterium]|jgi:outer membrane protein assembly factor BamE|nr:outer membrane protein assembly factor BamE [Pseudomonadota bacterium]